MSFTGIVELDSLIISFSYYEYSLLFVNKRISNLVKTIVLSAKINLKTAIKKNIYAFFIYKKIKNDHAKFIFKFGDYFTAQIMKQRFPTQIGCPLTYLYSQGDLKKIRLVCSEMAITHYNYAFLSNNNDIINYVCSHPKFVPLLEYACLQNNVSLIKVAIERGANDFEHGLISAITTNDLSVISLICNYTEVKIEHVIYASQYSRLTFLFILKKLPKTADVSYVFQYAMDDEIVEELLNYRISDYNGLLQYACRENNDYINLAVHYGANKWVKCLKYAVNHATLFKTIYENNIISPKKSEKCLIKAIQHDRLEIIDYLLAKDIQISNYIIFQLSMHTISFKHIYSRLSKENTLECLKNAAYNNNKEIAIAILSSCEDIMELIHKFYFAQFIKMVLLFAGPDIVISYHQLYNKPPDRDFYIWQLINHYY